MIDLTLRHLRESRSYSLTEVAAYCHVSASAVSAWERGINDPRPHQVRALAEFYKVTISEIQEALKESADKKDGD